MGVLKGEPPKVCLLQWSDTIFDPCLLSTVFRNDVKWALYALQDALPSCRLGL